MKKKHEKIIQTQPTCAIDFRFWNPIQWFPKQKKNVIVICEFLIFVDFYFTFWRGTVSPAPTAPISRHPMHSISLEKKCKRLVSYYMNHAKLIIYEYCYQVTWFLPGKSASRYIEYQNGERVTAHWPGTLGLNNKMY